MIHGFHRVTRLQLLTAVATLVLLVVAPAARAATVSYSAELNGLSEQPANDSPGTGTALVTIDIVDPDVRLMRVQVDFTGLVGTVTTCHIHGPTATAGAGLAGVITTVPTFPGFPAGVTAGSYDQTFDMTQAGSYNPPFITSNGGSVDAAFNALVAALDAGKAYLNIHTQSVTAGEIRGFLQAVQVPVESATWGRVKSLYGR